MKTLSYRTEGRIGYLTLNRPASYNAVDEPMATELHQFWNERRQDDTVGVIILDGGEAKGFCYPTWTPAVWKPVCNWKIGTRS